MFAFKLQLPQRDYVDRRKEVVELAGLNPVVVDIESFAFARAYQTLINFTQKKSLENSVLTAKDEIVAIVDIGATQFTFLVLSNQSIIYSVEQPFGGRQLTEDIQRHYNLTWAEAGRAKRKGGLDADYDEAMLNPFKTLLIEHLARSIQVFYSSTDTDKIDKLVLSGGVSKTDGLRDQVAEAMGIPAEVIDLSKSISVSHLPSSARLTADIPAMMLAFGLALASGEPMTSMNLLPWRQVLRSRRKKENIMTIIYAAGFAVCLVFLITLGLSIKIAKEEKNGQYLQDKISSLDKSLQEIKGLEIKKTELIGKINVLQGLHSPRADTAKIFDELVVAIPTNITVFSIQRNGNTVAVTGFANSNSDVSMLMRNIESSSLLANARLIEIEQQVIDGAITNQFYMDIEVDSI